MALVQLKFSLIVITYKQRLHPVGTRRKLCFIVFSIYRVPSTKGDRFVHDRPQYRAAPFLSHTCRCRLRDTLLSQNCNACSGAWAIRDCIEQQLSGAKIREQAPCGLLPFNTATGRRDVRNESCAVSFDRFGLYETRSRAARRIFANVTYPFKL